MSSRSLVCANDDQRRRNRTALIMAQRKSKSTVNALHYECRMPNAENSGTLAFGIRHSAFSIDTQAILFSGLFA
jgi:hypothetical protein